MEGYWFPTCHLCGRVLPSAMLVTTMALILTSSPTKAQLNLPLESIDHWSNEFGAIISGVVSRATGEIDIRAEYAMQGPVVEKVDGNKMVMDMKKAMEDMLQNKVEALSALVDVAEEAHAQHIYDSELQLEYPNAKALNTTEFELEENEHFNYIPVNLSMSTVHVPTNVYDGSTEVLNGVEWSEALDSHFQRNYEKDPTLTWQYFGSATGFFRNYPGMQWPTPGNGVDLFDCRTRGWYIQAATSPKDIVILLDGSGSMKGLRMAIAKATVKKILETLSDDDFFNVITFSEEPKYVDSCFNGTLVQANADNKKKVTEALVEVNTTAIAHFDKALEEAFELLRQVNESGKGAQCNRAIMLITDGAPETYEGIFQRYNWPEKNVRVFTYLIGREVGDNRQVQWMACSNKGFYSHISTLADVHEHVQEYINVISRPMVIDRANHTIWTSVYVDAAHDSELNTDCSPCTGLQLMTSVAAPVYDTRNVTSSKGILLGVMGTDVPLKELTKLTPKYKLGVNGYAFAITNNGYVLFHPDFRPTEGALIKPNYNSVDLAEVELEDPPNTTQLRRRMVDRESGDLEMTVKVHYDNMKRITVRKQHYFFTRISGTPFSLGIALPDKYGLHTINGKLKLDENSQLDAFTASEIKVANWNYCKMDTNETRQDPALMLRKYLEYGKQGNALYDERCDNDLIESILFDAVATRGALASWMKENRDGTMNVSTSKRNGIEIVFLGTKGGLTRYLPFTENLTDPHFIDNHTGTIEEMYYIQAVEGGDKVFTFSIPFDAAERYPELVVTASTPIVHSERKQEAVPMVVGLQMKYDKFYEFFMNSTLACQHANRSKCNLSCYSDEINCYLLDNNGYIVLSEESKQLGQFFGSVDISIMMRLLYDENSEGMSRGVFQQIQMYDYQGVCQIWQNGDSGATSMFINPLIQLVNIAWYLFNKFAWILLQFNIFSFWPSSAWASSDNDYTYYTHLDWNNVDMDEIDESNLTMCDTLKTLYRIPDLNVNLTIEQSGSFEQPDKNCTQSYSINRVVGTNLMLLVVDALCGCDVMPTPIEAEEVRYNKSMMCERLQTEIYRKRPSACYAAHANETSDQCGKGSRLHSPLSILLATLCSLCFLFVRH